MFWIVGPIRDFICRESRNKEIIKMKKRLFVLLAVIVVLSMALIPALADSDEDDADGVWCYTPNLAAMTPIEFDEYAGQKAFSTTTETGVWTGTFTGNSKEYGFLVFQDEFPRLFMATVWFDTVEVGGASGGLEMDVAGDLMPSPPETISEFSGRWVITGGTGELENLRGEGAWWGPGWQGDPEECGVIYYSVEYLDGIDIDDDDDDDDDNDDDD
jgi:hypothetical protein